MTSRQMIPVDVSYNETREVLQIRYSHVIDCFSEDEHVTIKDYLPQNNSHNVTTFTSNNIQKPWVWCMT